MISAEDYKYESTIKKFEVGKTYSTRSICDHNCIFAFKVLSRTEKTVTIVDKYGNTKNRRKIFIYENEEQILPNGDYSMAPVLSATDLDIIEAKV